MINFDSSDYEIYQYTDYFDKHNKINSFTCKSDQKSDQIYDKFKEYVEGELLLNLLPAEIYISTMTATCKINDFKFNCENIAKYIDIYDDIESVSYAFEEKGEKKIIHRTLTSKKENKIEKKNKIFSYNVVSIYLNIKTNNRPIHIKLWKNGLIYIIGCKSAIDIVETITTILSKLKNGKEFVSEKKYLDVSYVTNLKIDMINVNFKIAYEVNLPNLYELIVQKGIECRFDIMNHSCVNVKYNHPEKKISIFIFEKGSIVITGAKNGEHIKMAYDFINKFLNSNYKQIVKKDIHNNL
jgi:TATA-box binding protein (TBP) (component of TFIID and TFIIIB)